MSHIPQDEGQYSISELERCLEATENEREECLLKAATTRSVCTLLTNKLREITDEMDEQRGAGAQDPDGLQHRMTVLEKELAAICSEKDEVAARLEVLKPAARQPAAAPSKGSSTGDAAAAESLRDAQARLDHHLTDRRLLRDHIAFLKASTNCIKDERRAASKAMEEEHHAIKLALVQEVLQLRKQAEASEERVRWLNQAFTLLYEQCEEEGLGDLCE